MQKLGRRRHRQRDPPYSGAPPHSRSRPRQRRRHPMGWVRPSPSPRHPDPPARPPGHGPRVTAMPDKKISNPPLSPDVVIPTLSESRMGKDPRILPESPQVSPDESGAPESGASSLGDPSSAVSSPNLGSSQLEESPAAPFSLEPKPIPPAPEPKRNTASKDAKEKEEASQSPFS